MSRTRPEVASDGWNADRSRAKSISAVSEAKPKPKRPFTEGEGDIGGTLLPAPEGIWSMPPELLKTLPGYDPDVAKNRAEARKI